MLFKCKTYIVYSNAKVLSIDRMGITLDRWLLNVNHCENTTDYESLMGKRRKHG